MSTLVRRLRASAALISMCALLFPQTALAKPLDAQAVHAKILKRGIGNWVGIEEQNGVALIGRITSIDQDSFSLQLENYPETTPILYSDVIDIRTGPSKKTIFAIVGGTLAAGIIAGVVMHHEFEANKPQLPTTPTQPVFP